MISLTAATRVCHRTLQNQPPRVETQDSKPATWGRKWLVLNRPLRTGRFMAEVGGSSQGLEGGRFGRRSGG